MNLENHLRGQREAGRKLLVPYVTGGLGSAWLDVVRAVADAGADAIEIGIPFSDPVMDGLTIQEASRRALDLGATPAGVIGDAASLEIDVPLVVMTYTNPVGHMGYRRFAAALAASGRATYAHCTDTQAVEAFKLLSVTEGIVPALEPAHALGWLAEAAGSEIPAGATVLVTLSGRGDKDAHQVAELLGEPVE